MERERSSIKASYRNDQSLFSTVTLTPEDIKRDDDQSHGNNSEAGLWVATGKRSVLFSSGVKIGRQSGF